MDFILWIIIALLMLVGLVGTLLPLVPGHVLILAGAVLHQVMLADGKAGWWMVALLAVLLLLSMLVDFLSGAVGARTFGASRWGAVGGILGAIVGLFFGLIGLVVGPLVGVLLGELLTGKGILPAGKSTWGTFLGGVAGTAIKFLLALLMVAVFAGALYFS